MTLRPMTEADLPCVATWLAEPHVKRWWHVEDDLSALTAKYRPRLVGEEPTHMLIVGANDSDVGLAQWYRWDDYAEDRENYRIGAGELGIDYLIGSPDACGRGLGTAMIAALLDHLRSASPARTPVSVTPEAANVPSRRILEKNAFVHISTFQSAHLDGRAPEGPTAIYRRLL